jgi:hypothetical protein
MDGASRRDARAYFDCELKLQGKFHELTKTIDADRTIHIAFGCA